MIVLLIAGIGVIVAGLLAVGFGIPVKEFGFGNTLILTGTIGVCTGLLMLSLAVVLRELRTLAAHVVPGQQLVAPRVRRDSQLSSPEAALEGDGAEAGPATNAPLFSRDQPTGDRPTSDAPPWQDEVKRTRAAAEPSAAPDEEAPAPKQRRNLMFSSTRRERERAAAEAAQAEQDAAAPTPHTFDDAWPQSEQRPRLDTPRRPARTPSNFSEPAPAAAPEVTVLKSGVVDGMAYSLYSDGSIEAQMPEGMMRFASIDELREHLDQRG